MAPRTRYVPPASAPHVGTARRDINGNLIPGEFNGQGQPLGTPQPFAQGPDPFAPRSAFATGASNVARPAAPVARPPAPVARPVFSTPAPPRDYGVAAATAQLSPTSAFAPAPLTLAPPRAPAPTLPAAPVASTPAPAPSVGVPPTPARASAFALPSNPDDRALLMATRARDAAAKAPEPISIPGGLTGHAMRPGEKPWAPGGDSAEGNALSASVNRANGVQAPAPSNVDPSTLAAAGTGRTLKTSWGTVSSSTLDGGRMDGTGTPEAPARWTDTGVTHPQPMATTASPMDMPGYYPRPSLAATAAPPQTGAPMAPRIPEAATAMPPQAPAPLGIPAAATAAPPQGIPAPYQPPAKNQPAPVPSSFPMPVATSSVPSTPNSRIIARQSQPGFSGIPQALDPVLPVARSSSPSSAFNPLASSSSALPKPAAAPLAPTPSTSLGGGTEYLDGMRGTQRNYQLEGEPDEEFQARMKRMSSPPTGSAFPLPRRPATPLDPLAQN